LNKDQDIFASGGIEKKIFVSLNLTLLVVVGWKGFEKFQ